MIYLFTVVLVYVLVKLISYLIVFPVFGINRWKALIPVYSYWLARQYKHSNISKMSLMSWGVYLVATGLFFVSKAHVVGYYVWLYRFSSFTLNTLVWVSFCIFVFIGFRNKMYKYRLFSTDSVYLNILLVIVEPIYLLRLYKKSRVHELDSEIVEMEELVG